MICKQCGAQIEDNAAECRFCGVSYEENAVEETVAEEIIEETVEEETIDSEIIEDEVLGADTDDTDLDELLDENEAKRQKQVERLNEEKQNQIKEIEKRRKAKQIQQKRNKFIVVAVIVAIIAAIGGGSYMLWKESNEEPDIIIPTQTPIVTVAATVAPTPVVTAEPSPTPATEETPQPSIRPISPESESASSGNTSTSANSSSVATTETATSRPNIRPVQTEKPQQTVAPVVQPAKPDKTQASVSGVVPSTSSVSFGGREYNSEGGYSDGKFSSALVTGVEVMNTGDKSYMTFRYNGATYYANISPSTTTSFVSGRPMTISAYKTSENYIGSPVYEITAITNYTGKNILPNSGFELLTEADIANLSAAELRLARNEIYARHGRSFKDAEIRKYFEGCSWYKVKKSYNYANEAANLNSIEKANINFIIKHEK